MMVSALEDTGLAKAWSEITTLTEWRRAQGQWHSTRAQQSRHWFEEEVRRGLLSVLEHEPAKGILGQLGAEVAKGLATPEQAAARLLSLLGKG